MSRTGPVYPACVPFVSLVAPELLIPTIVSRLPVGCALCIPIGSYILLQWSLCVVPRTCFKCGTNRCVRNCDNHFPQYVIKAFNKIMRQHAITAYESGHIANHPPCKEHHNIIPDRVVLLIICLLLIKCFINI